MKKDGWREREGDGEIGDNDECEPKKNKRGKEGNLLCL